MPHSSSQAQKLRSRLYAETRRFLGNAGYLEVEVPVLADSLIPEAHLEVFETRYIHPYGDPPRETPLYLTPSPEVFLKRLIAAGWPSLFSISRAFRNAESRGRHHNPEFTMLEFYTRAADYADSIGVMRGLLDHLLGALAGELNDYRRARGRPPLPAGAAPTDDVDPQLEGRGGAADDVDPQLEGRGGAARDGTPPFQGAGAAPADDEPQTPRAAGGLDDGPQTPRAAGGLDAGSAAGASQHLAALPWADYTVDALMREYAGLPGGWAEDEDILRAAAGDIDPGREDFESLFNRLLVHYVEPRLPREGAVLLRDYPAGVPTLARKRGNSPWSERWELYLFGLEVANCYTEETDPEQVRAFFDSERRKKQSSVITHRIDAAYPAIFADVRDEVSGVAVGMDRLLMGLLGAEEIEEVLVFPAGSMIY